MPEHGRNQDGNGLYDGYGREALDHTNDDYSREIFSLILGRCRREFVFGFHNNILTVNTRRNDAFEKPNTNRR